MDDLNRWLGQLETSDRSPGSRLRGTRFNGSITILRERISKWVLIDILNFFHPLSTVICKIHLALIRHICSIKTDRTGNAHAAGAHPDTPRTCRFEPCSEPDVTPSIDQVHLRSLGAAGQEGIDRLEEVGRAPNG